MKKAFKVRNYVNQHMKAHTGGEPYKCDICHKYFTRADGLDIHKRIHTNERTFKCVLCGVQTKKNTSVHT